MHNHYRGIMLALAIANTGLTIMLIQAAFSLGTFGFVTITYISIPLVSCLVFYWIYFILRRLDNEENDSDNVVNYDERLH